MGTTLPEIKCKSCSELFTPKRPWQEFCSDKCRNNYHNDKKYGVYKDEVKNTFKCPYCKSESDAISPNIIEQIGPQKFLCNVCARVYFDPPLEPDHPYFTGINEIKK